MHTVFFVCQEQKRPRTCTIVRLTCKHVLVCTHVLVRQNLLQHLQGVFQNNFQCVGVPVTFNPFRTAVPFWGQTTQLLSNLSPKRDCGSKGVKLLLNQTFGCLVYLDLRLSTCCFSVRNCTSMIVSSTLVAFRGVTGQYSIAREIMETRERFAQLANLRIDRSADRLNSHLTYFFLFFFINRALRNYSHLNT